MSNVVVAVFNVVNVVVSMTINHNKINMIIDQLLAIVVAIAIAVAVAWPRCAGRFVFADDGDASVAAMIIMIIIIIIFSVVVAQFTDVNALTGLGRPHGRHRWAGGDGIAAAGGGCAG